MADAIGPQVFTVLALPTEPIGELPAYGGDHPAFVGVRHITHDEPDDDSGFEEDDVEDDMEDDLGDDDGSEEGDDPTED